MSERMKIEGMVSIERMGWFPDFDAYTWDGKAWNPCAQLEGRAVYLDAYFATEQECADFIRSNISALGMIRGVD